jgi:CheY-like chemotaxis protein
MSTSAARPILIADDDVDDLFFARRSLQKAGVSGEIRTCSDGREVVVWLEQAMQQPEGLLPRIVFLDVKMPELDGFQTLRWIRGEERLNGVSVVMLSGSGEARDTELARRLGSDSGRSTLGRRRLGRTPIWSNIRRRTCSPGWLRRPAAERCPAGCRFSHGESPPRAELGA